MFTYKKQFTRERETSSVERNGHGQLNKSCSVARNSSVHEQLSPLARNIRVQSRGTKMFSRVPRDIYGRCLSQCDTVWMR